MAKAPKKEAKPKAPKEPKAPKAPKEPKQAAPKVPAAETGHNLGIDPEKRELFLSDLRKWEALDKAAKSASAKRRSHEKTIKADGFHLYQIKLGALLSTPEGEEDFKMETANRLIAAQYVGAAIGTQLSLFLEPVRVPSVDMAYDEGIQDCMEGKTAKPSYDPSVPQHASYMRGYHDEQERKIKSGIQSDVKPNPSRAEVIAAARGPDVPPADKFN